MSLRLTGQHALLCAAVLRVSDEAACITLQPMDVGGGNVLS
jgi:hypothetical protein